MVLLGACAAAPVMPSSAPAQAADLVPLYKAPPPVYPSWTGFYVGGELGGKWADGTWTATSLRDPPGIPPAVGVVLPIDASSPTDYRAGSLRFGGYVGYNWQFDPEMGCRHRGRSRLCQRQRKFCRVSRLFAWPVHISGQRL